MTMQRMKGSEVPMVKRLREIAASLEEASALMQVEAERRIEILRQAERSARERPGPLYSAPLEVDDG